MTTSFNTLLRDDCLVDAMLGFFSSHRQPLKTALTNCTGCSDSSGSLKRRRLRCGVPSSPAGRLPALPGAPHQVHRRHDHLHPRRHRHVPPAPEPLLPAPLPETRQQMEVQQGNRNCNHSLKRKKPARCAGIPLEPLNECCLAVKRMPLAARRAWNGTAEALSRTSQAVPR